MDSGVTTVETRGNPLSFFEITSKSRIETKKEIIYPESDGKPMADNTEQYDWIVKIKENLEAVFADNPDVFIAGDLLWYPVEDDNKTRHAPDIMVAFGRPKGKRGSYVQYKEDNIAPQVVFEILSPSNTQKEMRNKLNWYERYGVKEYYEYDPETNNFKCCIRSNDQLKQVNIVEEWVSPLLKIRFEIGSEELAIYRPNGLKFLSPVESEKRAEKRAEAKIEQERKRADMLEAKLKELGLSLES